MSATQLAGTHTHLHRIKRVKNQHYVRDGKKSYAHVLRKYNIKPPVGGPFDMIDETHSPKDQSVIKRVQNRVAGRPNHISHRRLVKKHSDDQIGEVPADDIQNDVEYLAQIAIGSPQQIMRMDFDTGSADLQVFPSAACWSTELPRSVQAHGKSPLHNIFNPALSHTWKPSPGAKWTITYGDGSSANGDVGTDVVNIGGVVVNNQAVELAKTMSAQFQRSQGDGLLGLAWGSINTVTPTPVLTPMENMIAQSAIPAASELFTAYLGSVTDINDPDHGASFYTFGFIDQNVLQSNGCDASDIFYTPVDNSNGFWQVDSTSYSVNGQLFPDFGNTAIMDTGTTLAIVDSQTCKNIYASIPGAMFSRSVGGYIFPSNTALLALPLVSFDIGGKMFSINPEDIAFAPLGNGYSYGSIQDRGDLPFSIYGDTVLKNIYAIFDVGRKRFGAIQRVDPTGSLLRHGRH